MKIKVNNMRSAKGNEVPNQFEIRTDKGVYFQSYNTVIAFVPHGKTKAGNERKIVLDKNSWDYSRTTGKYRNYFLGENTAETRQKIKNGTYVLRDLNK